MDNQVCLLHRQRLMRDLRRPTFEGHPLRHRSLPLQSQCYGHSCQIHCLSFHHRTPPEHGAYGV
jgi:hypothetical protein